VLLLVTACGGCTATPPSRPAAKADASGSSMPITAPNLIVPSGGSATTTVPEPAPEGPTGLTEVPTELGTSDDSDDGSAPETVELPPIEPLPKGFVRIPDPRYDDTDHGPCGELTVFNQLDAPTASGALGEPFVRVLDGGGRQIYRARGRLYRVTADQPQPSRMSLVADICGDLTGDGVPELILTERTMGAHCCYTHYVVSLTRPTKTLLTWEKGDAGTGMRPVRAKSGRSWQLLSTVVVDPPGLDLAYAFMPLLPIVFQLEGETYRPRTFRFGDYLRQRRRERRERCRDHPKWCEGSIFIDWGEALILGDWAQQKQHVDATPDVIDELDRASPATKKLLKRLLGI
jgi:hypothetical protein